MRAYSGHCLLLSVAVLLSACGTTKPTLMGDPMHPYPPERAPVVGDILHLATGMYVTETQMLANATDNRIIYVGEVHDNPASHRQELAVLQAMVQRYPGQVAVGMEMFTPSQQDALDRWISGELDERAFLKESKWYQNWRIDFDYYRELLLYCREHQVPVIALNVEKNISRALGRNKHEELPEELRAKLPTEQLIDPYQQAMVEAVFGGHATSKDSYLEGFKRVQTLWDSIMAENIVDYLTSPQGEGRRMLVVAGGNHVRFGFGIPRRVFQQLPSSYTLIGTEVIVVPDDMKNRMMDVTLPKYPMRPYDFVAFAEYEKLASRGVKLGVMFAADKLTVLEVLPDSTAAAAEVQKDDLVKSLDGQPVADIYEIKYELKQKQPGEEGVLGIERNGETIELKVTFK